MGDSGARSGGARASGEGTPAAEGASGADQTAAAAPEESFAALDLRAARVLKAENHPNADRLFVITLDAGGEERVICSGLVGHYTPEELIGKTIVLAFNLKPAKFRGVKSHGMLLAAENSDGGLEVLTCRAAPGERAVLEGSAPGDAPGDVPGDLPPARVSIERFFETPIHVENGGVLVGGSALMLGGAPVRTSQVLNGKVG